MTTTRTPSQIIAKCRNGHTVRGIVDMGRYIATTPGASVSGNCWLHCPCGSAGPIKFMDVTVVEEKVCNGICMGAQGPSCSCSCGGENHGGRRTFSAGF